MIPTSPLLGVTGLNGGGGRAARGFGVGISARVAELEEGEAAGEEEEDDREDDEEADERCEVADNGRGGVVASSLVGALEVPSSNATAVGSGPIWERAERNGRPGSGRWASPESAGAAPQPSKCVSS